MSTCPIKIGSSYHQYHLTNIPPSRVFLLPGNYPINICSLFYSHELVRLSKSFWETIFTFLELLWNARDYPSGNMPRILWLSYQQTVLYSIIKCPDLFVFTCINETIVCIVNYYLSIFTFICLYYIMTSSKRFAFRPSVLPDNGRKGELPPSGTIIYVSMTRLQ